VDVPADVPALLLAHPSVLNVRLIGSRAEGTAHELSDWDFSVETGDFETLERDLPRVLAPLEAVAEQWDRYSPHACYMLMLPGPVKIDLLFLDEKRDLSPAWTVDATTLGAIDRHFWDWILWLEQQRRAGRDHVLATGLVHLHELLLGPMGVPSPPVSVSDAVDAYLRARVVLERRFGLTVSRDLEHEVRPVVQSRPAD
jgi:hypothetical protein